MSLLFHEWIYSTSFLFYKSSLCIYISDDPMIYSFKKDTSESERGCYLTHNCRDKRHQAELSRASYGGRTSHTLLEDYICEGKKKDRRKLYLYGFSQLTFFFPLGKIVFFQFNSCFSIIYGFSLQFYIQGKRK